MHSATKQAVLITLCCVLLGSVGCTTMDSMDGTQEALAEEKIRVGDKVFLHYNNGATLGIIALSPIIIVGVVATGGGM